MKNIHIGSLIKEQFENKQKRDKHFNKTMFAEKIHVHRASIYHIFEQKSIDIELLIRISKALDYDFIKEVYLKKTDDNVRRKIIVGIEITEEQFQQQKLPDDFLIFLEKNK